ncbi:MAG: SH3 domain-containing protein [Caldilineaceae bacterium]
MAKKKPNLSQMTARLALVLVLVFVAGVLSGCGIFGGEEKAEATPTAPPRTIVPTFTPTPVQPATATPEPVALNQTQVITVEAAAPAAAAPVTATTATTGTTPVSGTAEITGTSAATTTTAATTTAAVSAPVAAAPAVTPSLKIETDIINVRSGPDTSFGLVGTANIGERFEIKGRNADGSWYLICCVNGQQGWVNSQLTDEDNEELAPLVDTPAVPTPAPVAQAPAAQAPAPAEPTATPAPAAPAPAADACAGIGGDGCKFKLKGGPSFANNGGNELKFQIAFVHSGIEGGQPQGSYFVWVEKDGQKLPVSDSVRSIALQAQQGPQGKYNYEYKIGRDQLPGGNVAGSYQIWVLDGNGERDSQTFSFTVPDGQGEVWMLFDQA